MATKVKKKKARKKVAVREHAVPFTREEALMLCRVAFNALLYLDPPDDVADPATALLDRIGSEAGIRVCPKCEVPVYCEDVCPPSEDEDE